jgi:hypothetical protein
MNEFSEHNYILCRREFMPWVTQLVGNEDISYIIQTHTVLPVPGVFEV